MSMTLRRRQLLTSGLGLAGGALLLAGAPARAQQTPACPTSAVEIPETGTHLLLLGTMAGPVLDPRRMMASQAVVVDGSVYLVDCGYGTILRLVEAGLRPADVKAIFVTHHHSDHNADYVNLVHLAWIQGIEDRIVSIGPPPFRSIHDAALAFHREDIAIRIAGTGRKPIAEHFDVREVAEPGLVYEDEKLRVRCGVADHPPFATALGFRFETPGRSIAFSGDTAASASIAALAEGADVLVHEAMHVPGIDAMLAKRRYVPPKLRQFLVEGHTSAEDAGRIAAEAGVGTLVLSHLLPGDQAEVTDAIWAAEAAKHFDGTIVVGRDLMLL
jgi:ribonuclease BN (tRNA processing enzyme)